MPRENKTYLVKPKKIIVSHKNPDFDSFSASVAAQKMYKDFVIVSCGEGTQNLEEFFSLYKEKIPFFSEETVDFSEIAEVIVVDTCLLERLGALIQKAILENKPLLRVFDHHPYPDEQVFPGQRKAEVIIEEIGSATTVVVEQIKKKNLEIDKVEATLFSIGIYEDTGNFLFSSTTSRDMQASAFLLEKGANLDVVSAFVKVDMTIEQKRIMEELLSNKIVKRINQVEIAIGIAESEKFVGGLNLIVSKLWMSEGYDTFIAIVRMSRKVYVVGRTVSPDVNLGEMMATLSGGGHKRAAACKLADVTVEEAFSIVANALEKFVTAAVKAKNLMSSPVKTVFATLPIQAIHRIFEETGYGGLPVIENHKLVGIIVRRDVQKAMAHNLGSKPVKSIMSTIVQVVDAEDSLEKIKKMMVENGIGRIPVLNQGVLVGIISRTDLIRASYKNNKEMNFLELEPYFRKYDTRVLLQRTLPSEIYRFLVKIGLFGDRLGIKTYVVGGFVRDLLMKTPNLDIDVVVEGNAIDFVKKISAQKDSVLHGEEIEKIEYHEVFQGAKVLFAKGFEVDFASARIETYDFPGALPKVEFSHIKKDLVRRDFSINAMAIDLSEDNFGHLLDFFNCRKDLEMGLIRVLYNTSFIDDPTRILRGIRYEVRHSFQIEERTLELLKEALSEKYLQKVSGGRIRNEIQRCLAEKRLFILFQRMGELAIFKHCFSYTYYTDAMELKLKRFFENLNWVEKFYTFKGNFSRFYALLYVLLEYYTQEQLTEIEKNFGIPKKIIKDILVFSKKVEILAKMVNSEMAFSDLYIILEGTKPEALAYLCAYLTEDGMNHFKEYSRIRKGVHFLYVKGNLLGKTYRIKEGSHIRNIMSGMIKEKIDHRLNTEQEEKQFIEEYLQNLKTFDQTRNDEVPSIHSDEQ